MPKKPASDQDNGEQLSNWKNEGGALEQHKERPRDANHLAKLDVDLTESEIEDVAQASRDGAKKSGAGRSGHLVTPNPGQDRSGRSTKKRLSEPTSKAANARRKRR